MASTPYPQLSAQDGEIPVSPNAPGRVPTDTELLLSPEAISAGFQVVVPTNPMLIRILPYIGDDPQQPGRKIVLPERLGVGPQQTTRWMSRYNIFTGRTVDPLDPEGGRIVRFIANVRDRTTGRLLPISRELGPDGVVPPIDRMVIGLKHACQRPQYAEYSKYVSRGDARSNRMPALRTLGHMCGMVQVIVVRDGTIDYSSSPQIRRVMVLSKNLRERVEAMFNQVVPNYRGDPNSLEQFENNGVINASTGRFISIEKDPNDRFGFLVTTSPREAVYPLDDAAIVYCVWPWESLRRTYTEEEQIELLRSLYPTAMVELGLRTYEEVTMASGIRAPQPFRMQSGVSQVQVPPINPPPNYAGAQIPSPQLPPPPPAYQPTFAPQQAPAAPAPNPFGGQPYTGAASTPAPSSPYLPGISPVSTPAPPFVPTQSAPTAAPAQYPAAAGASVPPVNVPPATIGGSNAGMLEQIRAAREKAKAEREAGSNG